MNNVKRPWNRQQARQPTARVVRKVVNTGYSEHGANTSKGSMKTWNPMPSSPSADIGGSLSIMHARSRDLYMGNTLANSAVKTARTNVIGAGLKVRPRIDRMILGLSPGEAQAWERYTAKEFDLWAKNKGCDLYKQNNLYDLQDIAYLGQLLNGDAFALIKYRQPTKLNPYHLRIQLIEADLVSNPDCYCYTSSDYNVINTNPSNGNKIVNGVEINSDGAVVAYWICNRYMYDPTNIVESAKWQRVEAYNLETDLPNIMQICHLERPGQYRGIPELAPVIDSLKQIGRYTDAELTTAVIRSFFSLFFTQNKEASAVIGGFPIEGNYEHEKRETLDPKFLELGPGTMNTLPQGYDVKSMGSNVNASNYDIFVTHLLKQVGASLEIPYEVLIKSFNASYSASRAALLQAWTAFKTRRQWFVRDFCQPIYEIWLAEAIALGRIKAPGYFEEPLKQAAWSNSLWYGPVMGVLDPVKEIQAAKLRISTGLSTREKESLEMTGTEYEENFEQLARENDQARALGLKFSGEEMNDSEVLENQE
ncbi:MAG: phage portal protein [Acidaminococcaceae bacterium]